MGSLTSRPKLPPVQQQPLIISMPAAAPAPDSSGIPAETGAPDSSSGESEAEARSMGLLNRNRGRLGTVLTGFRGILAPATSTYKTLLGE